MEFTGKVRLIGNVRRQTDFYAWQLLFRQPCLSASRFLPPSNTATYRNHHAKPPNTLSTQLHCPLCRPLVIEQSAPGMKGNTDINLVAVEGYVQDGLLKQGGIASISSPIQELSCLHANTRLPPRTKLRPSQIRSRATFPRHHPS